MDPISAFTGLQALSAVGKGLAGRADAMNNAAAADAKALLAETQALQRDTQSRSELDSFLGGLRAARAASGLSSTSPNAIALATHGMDVMNRDRMVERANYRQEASNFRAAARSYRTAGRMSLVTGLVNAGIPLYQGRTVQ